MRSSTSSSALSPWWRRAILVVMIFGFSILIYMTINAYHTAPPIPDKVVTKAGEVLFTGDDIRHGQEIFLKYGLMDNGTIWGHGAYLGPDFSAAFLHNLSIAARTKFAQDLFQKKLDQLSASEKLVVEAETTDLLKTNHYDAKTGVLVFSDIEASSFSDQIVTWTNYFNSPKTSAGMTQALISDPAELRQLTAFFAWTSWVSVAERPDKPYSYTNNFPYDPSVGNRPTTDAIIWSALSLISLLGGTAIILFSFGRWNFLGWKRSEDPSLEQEPAVVIGNSTPAQRGTIKFFVIVGLLLLAQVAAGALIAHYRAEPGSFYGLDLSKILPSNISRAWHLQLAIFWIATSYVAGALFLAPILNGKDAKRQVLGINILFGALVLVVGGSLLGEWLGVNGLMGNLWFWLGNQGWEFLELGRVWQILLAIGLILWLFLLFRALQNTRQNPDRKEIASLFIIAAIGIPIFYIPAMFFNSTTNFTVVDTWRFWIIHLWVEGFFELFATVMVAIIFFVLGVVSKKTAIRVMYLDAILYLAGGLVGTGHHWYWTGLANPTMAFSAVFSALEVVPLTLLTLDAWDFIKLARGKFDIVVKHKWTFFFLMAVGFWNFLGAGVFGFLINMPIISYFEVGTMLTPNHGHTALMGVFGMLSLALMVFALRQVLVDSRWKRIEKFIKVAFWGLNIGLLLMSLVSLFPGGIMQLVDVLNNGYWHARSQEFLGGGLIKSIEWIRIVPDLIFSLFGVIPLVIAVFLTYWDVRKIKNEK